jgi:hypothetical protein
MAPTMMMECASMIAKMLFKPATVHAVARRARPTPTRRCDSFASRSSFALDALSAASASRAISNASPTLSASVTNSESIGDVTTNPPSSASSRKSVSFPSETV